jgi:hypothetical protein
MIRFSRTCERWELSSGDEVSVNSGTAPILISLLPSGWGHEYHTMLLSY